VENCVHFLIGLVLFLHFGYSPLYGLGLAEALLR
jgi:hypothetical protein